MNLLINIIYQTSRNIALTFTCAIALTLLDLPVNYTIIYIISVLLWGIASLVKIAYKLQSTKVKRRENLYL